MRQFTIKFVLLLTTLVAVEMGLLMGMTLHKWTAIDSVSQSLAWLALGGIAGAGIQYYRKGFNQGALCAGIFIGMAIQCVILVTFLTVWNE